MSLIMMRDVLKYSPSKGSARLVELARAEAVNDERVRLGHEPLSWLSQNTAARLCNCSRSTVERSDKKLENLGRLTDTGSRRTRGVVVYRLAAPHLDDPWVLTGSGPRDLTHDGSGDLTQSDVTQTGSSADDLTQSAADLTQPGRDLTQSAARPASTVTHKPVVEPGSKPKVETDARPPAREDYPDGQEDAARVAAQREHNASVPTDPIISGLSPSSTGTAGPTPAQIEAERAEKVAELDACEKLLAEGRGGQMTKAIAVELREELGIVEVAS